MPTSMRDVGFAVCGDINYQDDPYDARPSSSSYNPNEYVASNELGGAYDIRDACSLNDECNGYWDSYYMGDNPGRKGYQCNFTFDIFNNAPVVPQDLSQSITMCWKKRLEAVYTPQTPPSPPPP